MPLPSEYGDPIRISATATAISGPCVIVGVWCNSSTSGVISLRDGTSGTPTPFVNALTVAAGTFYPLKMACATGLHFTLVSGSADVTLVVAR